MLNNIYLPVIENGSGVNGNWDMSMIDGTMQIAVFTENSAMLAQRGQTTYAALPRATTDRASKQQTKLVAGDDLRLPVSLFIKRLA